MLHALLHRKLRVANSTIEYRDAEDHLTAAVFARISYLTPHLASRLIESSIAATWPDGRTGPAVGQKHH